MDSKVTNNQRLIENIIFTYVFEHISEDLYKDMINYVMRQSGKTKKVLMILWKN